MIPHASQSGQSLAQMILWGCFVVVVLAVIFVVHP
jgi:uncharacterized membrane protein YjfL (UPF0719 family)